jgi:hypothetical protein
MELEIIKLKDLYNACNKPVKSSKENIESNSVVPEYKNILVQKNQNDMMRVVDGKTTVNTLYEATLENELIDTARLLCSVQYIDF